jgi:hypothetical protein
MTVYAHVSPGISARPQPVRPDRPECGVKSAVLFRAAWYYVSIVGSAGLLLGCTGDNQLLTGSR